MNRRPSPRRAAARSFSWRPKIMSSPPRRLDCVCVYCGSSDGADGALVAAAAALGEILAREGLRLVYGGGGVGLIGGWARAAPRAGGRGPGVIPGVLTPTGSPPPTVQKVV